MSTGNMSAVLETRTYTSSPSQVRQLLIQETCTSVMFLSSQRRDLCFKTWFWAVKALGPWPGHSSKTRFWTCKGSLRLNN